VIDLPVNDADQMIVVEGVLKDVPGESKVLISKTGTVYDDTGFEKISDASVIIEDDLGASYSFIPDPLQEGKYVLPSFVAEENRIYTLNVLAEDEIITATSSSRSKPKIDSLSYKYEDFGITDSEFAFYLVSYHSVDNANEVNHYRLRIWVNEEEVDLYYLGDDQFINGQDYAPPFYGTSPDLGDTIDVEILEMDKVMYDYYYGLSYEVDNSSAGVAPANPTSNLEGNAIGYFGVFMTDTASIIIQ
jgi:hypothetical protein